MSIKGEWIRYGNQTGYLAIPDHVSGPLPGVVVIQEAWGMNDHIQDVTRRIAAAGYAALAPDLFAENGERPPALDQERITELLAAAGRMPPGALFNPDARDVELAKLPEPEQSRVRESVRQLLSKLNQPQNYIGPLREAVSRLRAEQPETRGQKVACVGFCMGGGLSALLACEEPELSGAAVFYGRLPEADKVAGIQCPVAGFFGANDSRVNAGISGFVEAMAASGKSFEHHIYENAGHAFFNDSRSAYEVNAARDAFMRLLAFFSRVLTG